MHHKEEINRKWNQLMLRRQKRKLTASQRQRQKVNCIITDGEDGNLWDNKTFQTMQQSSSDTVRQGRAGLKHSQIRPSLGPGRFYCPFSRHPKTRQGPLVERWRTRPPFWPEQLLLQTKTHTHTHNCPTWGFFSSPAVQPAPGDGPNSVNIIFTFVLRKSERSCEIKNLKAAAVSDRPMSLLSLVARWSLLLERCKTLDSVLCWYHLGITGLFNG